MLKLYYCVMESKELQIKIDQVWRRNFKWEGIEYIAYYKTSIKNSNNMWKLELLFSKPCLPIGYSLDKNPWISKRLLLQRYEYLSNKIDLKTIKVLYG